MRIKSKKKQRNLNLKHYFYFNFAANQGCKIQAITSYTITKVGWFKIEKNETGNTMRRPKKTRDLTKVPDLEQNAD